MRRDKPVTGPNLVGDFHFPRIRGCRRRAAATPHLMKAQIPRTCARPTSLQDVQVTYEGHRLELPQRLNRC